ncbi:MAG: glycerol-3-phosphate acyltransferase, partial [Gemmatimonadetes bacterium]|nr:glycerol-3-phosphate acyltransferase [Gemmatimonadota bacterium]
GVAAVLGLYFLLNAVLLRVLPFAAIRGSELPLAELAAGLVGPPGKTLVLALGVGYAIGSVPGGALLIRAATGRNPRDVNPHMLGVENVFRLLGTPLAVATFVLDVRGRAEWESGHLPGVENIPVGFLTDRLGEIPRDRPVVVQCQGGGRSAIAASVLQAHGYDNVANLPGGFVEWEAQGHPVEPAVGNGAGP